MLLLRTLLLKTEPAGNLRSLDELFALANAMEQEAATQYAELAEEMKRHNKSDLAEVFTQLAAAERDHVDSVTRLSHSRRGKAPDPRLVRWEAPETLDPGTATELKSSRLMTPYRALATAVRNEERAFAFWSYLAAFAKDPEIKQAAEDMAREELGHVSTLRKERRRAYHRERHESQITTKSSDAAVQVDAGTLERRLEVLLADLERSLTSASADRARELWQDTKAMSTEVAGFGRFPASLQESDAQTIAEALTDAYLEGAERVTDPARLESLQKLAARAIARLAWIRSLS
jgi:rubrerythrin